MHGPALFNQCKIKNADCSVFFLRESSGVMSLQSVPGRVLEKITLPALHLINLKYRCCCVDSTLLQMQFLFFMKAFLCVYGGLYMCASFLYEKLSVLGKKFKSSKVLDKNNYLCFLSNVCKPLLMFETFREVGAQG